MDRLLANRAGLLSGAVGRATLARTCPPAWARAHARMCASACTRACALPCASLCVRARARTCLRAGVLALVALLALPIAKRVAAARAASMGGRDAPTVLE